MEAPLITSQLALILPVGVVIILAFLVFAFGFKSSVEPPSFKHISFTPDDRKNTKKKRAKDKKPQTNGHATVVIDVPETKKLDSAKPAKQVKVETPKQKKNAESDQVVEKKPEAQKSPAKKEKKANVQGNKKNAQNNANEKPADFDEGEWEVAPSRKDKKSKKKDDADVLPVYTPEKNAKKKLGPKKDDKVTLVKAKPMEVLKLEDILPPSKIKDIEAVVPTIVETAPTPTPDPVIEIATEAASETVAEDQAAKKKKAKKAKTVPSDDDAVVPEVAPSAPAAAPPPPVIEPVAAATEPVTESPQAFNELEDTWKEAPQKKSKKKVRKD